MITDKLKALYKDNMAPIVINQNTYNISHVNTIIFNINCFGDINTDNKKIDQNIKQPEKGLTNDK